MNNNANNPYTPPESDVNNNLVARSSIPKVIGIISIILGALGLIFGLFGNVFSRWSNDGNEQNIPDWLNSIVYFNFYLGDLDWIQVTKILRYRTPSFQYLYGFYYCG